MPIYRAQMKIAVNESFGAFKWSNVFFVDAASATAACDYAITLWDSHWRQAHSATAFMYEVYASDLLSTTVDYAIKPHALTPSIFGAVAASGDLMPLFVVARVDLNVTNSRPSRKYVRGPYYEGGVNTDNLTGTSLTGLQTAANGVVGSGIRDESGAVITSATLKGITSRRLGKFAYVGVPGKPVVS